SGASSSRCGSFGGARSGGDDHDTLHTQRVVKRAVIRVRPGLVEREPKAAGGRAVAGRVRTGRRRRAGWIDRAAVPDTGRVARGLVARRSTVAPPDDAAKGDPHGLRWESVLGHRDGG